jgi:hypothetical protein
VPLLGVAGVTIVYKIHAREAICRRTALAIDVEEMIFNQYFHVALCKILIQMLFLQDRRRKRR